jgi:CRP/FNR family transcriptional regulator, dissimilatory nitrate respiration regulator
MAQNVVRSKMDKPNSGKGVCMSGSHPVEIETHLSRTPLFESLAPDELARMAKGTREVRMRKGGILFRRGDDPTGLYVLLTGQMKIAVSSPLGIEKIVQIVQPGQSFGEATMFSDKPYLVSAQALVQSVLLHVAKAVIYEELDHNFQFARKMLTDMAKRFDERMTHVEAIALQSGTQRFISFILAELPDGHGDENVVLELPARKGVIASRLSLTPEHFSRILHDLDNLGLIAVEGKQISIPCVPQLKKYQRE